MKITSKALAKSLAILAVGAVALTGCTNASQQQPSSSSSGAASFDPTTVAKDDTLAAQVSDTIKTRGTLLIGADTSYAPAEFLGGNDGRTPLGYDVDLSKAIAATLGLKVEVQTADFNGILPALGSKYDLGISSFTINSERLKAVNMVSYFNAGVQWAVQKGNPKNFSLDDVCGKNIGVQTGTVEEEDVTARSKKCTDAGKAAINIVSLAKQAEVTTRLTGGAIDAMSADSPVTRYAISQTGDKLELLGSETDAAQQGIAVAKTDTALADLVAKVVNKLMADGTYKKILDAWSNSAGAIDKAVVNPAAAS
ncbi:polar amino acid transport system substrate-binding protein [Psychromicrobium silvestre]|uniref:Polar amino acid transport system substrate-binding protein n=1 Tax=Psychromicrobium silvestre TaxID=1645614 RepID=A0A7Y9LTU2_9MICC|nr:ABC transporter substrate-binding protein [Psychromicrobium silvestre]NYE95488.1 polar amino acid transport system substrate-binding protein [Psychromicrobium silvestre]